MEPSLIAAHPEVEPLLEARGGAARARVLEAITQVVADKGYAAMTVADVVQRRARLARDLLRPVRRQGGRVPPGPPPRHRRARGAHPRRRARRAGRLGGAAARRPARLRSRRSPTSRASRAPTCSRSTPPGRARRPRATRRCAASRGATAPRSRPRRASAGSADALRRRAVRARRGRRPARRGARARARREPLRGLEDELTIIAVAFLEGTATVSRHRHERFLTWT